MNLRLAEVVSGRSNHTPLTKKGYAQARAAGKWLTQHGIVPTIAITSPALRTRETLATCLDAMGIQVPVIVEDQIQEISHGDMEGKPRPHVWNEERQRLLAQDPLNYALPGGESIVDVQERKMNWLNVLVAQYPHERVVLATGHGYAIKSLAGHLLGWDHAQIAYTDTPNCSLTHIIYDNGAFTVDYVGRDIVAELAESA
jgi:probable phosphoglycerate mutase